MAEASSAMELNRVIVFWFAEHLIYNEEQPRYLVTSSPAHAVQGIAAKAQEMAMMKGAASLTGKPRRRPGRPASLVERNGVQSCYRPEADKKASQESTTVW